MKTLKTRLPAQGLELTTFGLRFSCLRITFITGMWISLIDHFAPVTHLIATGSITLSLYIQLDWCATTPHLFGFFYGIGKLDSETVLPTQGFPKRSNFGTRQVVRMTKNMSDAEADQRRRQTTGFELSAVRTFSSPEISISTKSRFSGPENSSALASTKSTSTATTTMTTTTSTVTLKLLLKPKKKKKQVFEFLQKKINFD